MAAVGPDSTADAALKGPQTKGAVQAHLPGQPTPEDNDQRQGHGRGDWPGTHPAGDWPGTHPASERDDAGMTGKMTAMFDGLRAAAAEHDSDVDLLPPLLHGDADTRDQPKH